MIKKCRAADHAEPHLMIIELNEFEPDHLRRLASENRLQHLKRALSLKHTATTTLDQVERHGLDPWTQWVGIHCGQPTKLHGIRRLGATRAQASPQLWHKIADMGYSWGVWGAMNAPMGEEHGCCFYMPDPWSFDEIAYPSRLNELLALPRYTAKNYLEVDFRSAFSAALQLARFLSSPEHWHFLPKLGLQASRGLVSAGANVHTLTTLYDYLSVLCFIKLRRQLRPNLSLIFLNHIAHLQHQFWLKNLPMHPQMRFGLKLCDAMLGLLLGDRRDGEALLLLNGLKQRNVAGEGFYIYRQRNPQAAIEALGIAGGRVEQNMTNDSTILFSESNNADEAFTLLNSCYLSDGHKAFYVERQSANRVFYEIAFDHSVSLDTLILWQSKSRFFYDLFELICERTGAHVPEGDAFCDGIEVSDGIQNHEIFAHILAHFSSRKDALEHEGLQRQNSSNRAAKAAID